MLIKHSKGDLPSTTLRSKSGAGFTLIEALVAAFLITMGAGAAFILIQQITNFTFTVSSQFKASYLAQEGMEIVRNIRDTNFLSIHKGQGGEWTDNLTGSGCETGCEADYTSTSLSASQDRLLQINGGFYNYGLGEDTIFKRIITIIQPSDDVLFVAVDVSWEEQGNAHSVKAATELYNWLTPTIPE